MTVTFKIKQGSWLNLNDGILDTMSTTAALILSVEADYPEVKEEAKELTEKANAYHLAFSRFNQFGGIDNRDVKDAARALLHDAHEVVAEKLEATSNGNRDYLTRPGYKVDNRSSIPSRARILPPDFQLVESKKVRGRVKFILKSANPKEIKGVIGKYSEDNGLTWIEGRIIQFGLNFTLDGQASGKAVLYQFMFRATNHRESDWSEVVRVDVF